MLDEVLGWLDHEVFSSRTPYDIAIFRPHMVLGTFDERQEGDVIINMGWLPAFDRDEYHSQARTQIRERLAKEITRPGVDADHVLLTLLRVGDVVEAVLASASV